MNLTPFGINYSDCTSDMILIFASWQINVDSDTAGYDLYIDPIPGMEGMLSGLPDAQRLVCPDTGVTSTPDATMDGGDGGDADPPGNDGDPGDDGAGDAGEDGPSDSGDDGGGDDGSTLDAGVTANSGLKDNAQYNVVVTAVDAFGHIGPPSAEACNSPAPIEDFSKIYRDDGGGAGGGFCALEEIGAHGPSTAGLLLFGGCGALLVRRRMARRRSRRGGVDARRNIQ